MLETITNTESYGNYCVLKQYLSESDVINSSSAAAQFCSRNGSLTANPHLFSMGALKLRYNSRSCPLKCLKYFLKAIIKAHVLVYWPSVDLSSRTLFLSGARWVLIPRDFSESPMFISYLENHSHFFFPTIPANSTRRFRTIINVEPM